MSSWRSFAATVDLSVRMGETPANATWVRGRSIWLGAPAKVGHAAEESMKLPHDVMLWPDEPVSPLWSTVCPLTESHAKAPASCALLLALGGGHTAGCAACSRANPPLRTAETDSLAAAADCL